MGREIRRVPEGWEHPKKHGGIYQPMFDESYRKAADAWIADLQLWVEGAHPDSKTETDYDFWEWAGAPPDREYYRPEFESEPTWFQVYETVSEGTPVSPAFATEDELIDYLVENGDFWDQRQRNEGITFGVSCEPPSREAVTRFVKGGWAPSMIVTNGAIKSGIRALCD